MHRKNVLFVQDGMGSIDRISRVVGSLDAELSVCQLRDIAQHVRGHDLVIFSVDALKLDRLPDFEKALVQAGGISCLLVVEEDALKKLRLPTRVPIDFAAAHATEDELAVRMRQLLWPGEETAAIDYITVDSMSINLSTYQVQVDGQPVDFTYLEYALLAFLVTHPGHAYSRDTLLRRVWGFEYYGGSRTVDVHVRRVRAKLGTELAARLETVRGVGYMWSM